MKLSKRVLAAAVAIWAALAPALARAQPSVIRDAEIEDTIRGYATPLLQAAGISPGDVDLILVNDDSINAFVAGGMKIFIYTGLLRRVESPDEVIGVLAHEIGHIAGGHIARLGSELEQASTQALLATILGVAAAVAAGRGDVGAAVAVGGQSSATRMLLAHTRVQESAADQAAFRYLDATDRTAEGLVDLLGRLADQELISSRYQDPYVRTHPLSRDRLETARVAAERAGPNARHASPAELRRLERIQAKLAGFMDPPTRTLDRYKGDDANSRYARSIAHYRRGDLAQALPLIDGLIAEEPDDPFLVELKGQMLLENGRAEPAADAYMRAVVMRPDDPALLAPAARALIEAGRDTDRAIEMLRRVTLKEPRNPGAWRQLGIAYGKTGDIGQASVALAEAAMLSGQKEDAAIQANRAQAHLEKGSAGWLKAEDILRAAVPKR